MKRKEEPRNANDRVTHTLTCCVKVEFSNSFNDLLDELIKKCRLAVERMFSHRDWTSSKYYADLVPCVVSKGLLAKYQKNPKCRRVQNLVIPVCGDKGRQIKLVAGGIRVPAVFKKTVLPVNFPREVVGNVRSIELLRYDGRWFGSVCYNTPKGMPINCDGAIGVDRNSVGNVSVFSDPQTGTVRKLGICPARTKFVFRRRRKNLQRAGKTRLLKKVRRKQRRRMSYENHRATRAVVDYAARHRRAVVVEKLEGITSKDCKIRGYSEHNQWAFAQFGWMLRYKCALRGIPLIEVDPAYTSQACSRCGSIHKPDGKRFKCLTCGHNDHRDANSGFVIAQRSLEILNGGSSSDLSVSELGLIGDPQAETIGASYGRQ